MKDEARRKKFQLLQKSLLKEEKKKYKKSTEEYAKRNNADLKEAPYIQQRYIEKIEIGSRDILDMKLHIEEVEEAKERASRYCIKVSVKEDISGYDTKDDEYIKVPTGHWIMGYELLSDSVIKSRVKNAFIDSVSQEAHKRYIELNPKDKTRGQSTVSCFLIEAFLNGEIEFDFLVRATYKGCNI